MNETDFLPVDYKIPETSNYMKFQDGDNAFRILSSAITGSEYFKADNKPVRSKEPFDTIPDDIKKGGAVKTFWAFLVWNYEAKRIQILELTQKGIMKTIQSYTKNPKWGNPKEYDFIVTRTGSGMDTEYAITVNPKFPLDEVVTAQYEKMSVDLNALYEGLDPFSVDK
ncbi:MAG: hypothetical protein WC648_01070 [Candidatus Paceibacterota bacterium]|jgi:hypothetical protein